METTYAMEDRILNSLFSLGNEAMSAGTPSSQMKRDLDKIFERKKP